MNTVVQKFNAMFCRQWEKNRKEENLVASQKKLPSVSVIVPVYNEESLIVGKIINLVAHDYKGEAEIIIVDGNSTDETFKKAIRYTDPPGLKIHITARKGKTHQINRGLDMVKRDIVFITDVDALMEHGCISKMMKEFEDPKVAVVGACSVPDKARFLDPLCWRISNYLRMGQANRITAPWVIGTCYAFRRSLLEQFPEDVVADDCYIALWANFEGHKALYTGVTVVREIRNPKSWGEFFVHKHRKANALLREFTRFSYRMAYAQPGWKALFMFWFLFLIIVAGWSYPFFKQSDSFKKIGGGDLSG